MKKYVFLILTINSIYSFAGIASALDNTKLGNIEQRKREKKKTVLQ